MNSHSWPITSISYRDAETQPTLLDKLVTGELAVLRVEGALTPDVLSASRRVIGSVRPTVNRYSNADLTTIGPYLANRLSRPDSYFAEASCTDLLFKNIIDPRAIARNVLAQIFGLQNLTVLREPGDGLYAPAVIRLHPDDVSNPLHNDNIVRDAAGSGLRVARLASQLSCVICLQECDAGGELELYRRQWVPDDEKWKVAGELGYRNGAVEGCERAIFKPSTGDIYVLNPTFYHAIRKVAGKTRITAGFFFGLFDSNPAEAFAWA